MNKTKLPSPPGAPSDHTFSPFPTHLPRIKKNMNELPQFEFHFPPIYLVAENLKTGIMAKIFKSVERN